MKNRLIAGWLGMFALGIAVAWAGPVQAQSAFDANVKWGSKVQEALDALKLKGDAKNGEEAYAICAACHQPTAWGDPASPGSFSHFINGYMNAPRSYKPTNAQWPGQAFARFDGLMQHAAAWGVSLRNSGPIPRPPADMRITPKP